MKPVNFIQPLSAKNRSAIHRWCFFSILVILCIFVILISFSIPQYLLLLHTKKEVLLLREKTKEHSILLKQKEALQKSEAAAQKKKALIMRYINNIKNPYPHLQLLTNSCKGNLEAIRFTKKKCELVAHYKTMHDATSCTEALSDTTLFSSVQLTNLSYDMQKKEFRCTIKGTLMYT